jgi:hypothetical protein
MSRFGPTTLLIYRFGRYRNFRDASTPIVTRLISNKYITNCNRIYFQSKRNLSLQSVLGLKKHGYQAIPDRTHPRRSGKFLVEIYIKDELIYKSLRHELLIITQKAKLEATLHNHEVKYTYTHKDITYWTKVKCGNMYDHINSVKEINLEQFSDIIKCHKYFGSVVLYIDQIDLSNSCQLTIYDFLRAVKKLSKLTTYPYYR